MTEVSFFVFLKNFMNDGGVFMWVILCVWIVGVVLSFYKFVTLKMLDVNATKLYDQVKGLVLNNNVQEAITLCSNSNAVLPQVMKAGLKRANQAKDLVEDALTATITDLTPKIVYYLSYIQLVANISTLIGLLGTIQGLILSFAGVAEAAPGEKSKILAMGIAKAMNTTALGLVSAISIMVVYTILVNKAQRMNDDIDKTAFKLVDLLSVKTKKV